MRWQCFLLILIAAMIPSMAVASDNLIYWAGDNTLAMSKPSQIIDPALASDLNNKTDNDQTPVWVFFTDKGIYDESSYQARLQDVRSYLTQAALERRLKTRGDGNIVDFRDIPVDQDYITQVLSGGGQARQILKWFNAITIEATKSDIERIAGLSFVRYIREIEACRSSHDVTYAPIEQNSELSTLNYGPSAGQINQINVVPAHELGFNGGNVIICMMDVGYKVGHQAFQPIINSGRLLAQYDFINHDDNTDYDPNQDSPSQADHGTLTWSTLGGESSGHLYGPSYQASFCLAKTEDVSSERHIEEDNWAAGAQWADSIGASVISSSLGYRVFDSGQGDYQYSDLNGHTTIVALAAAQAARNGITVCNAMGNEGNYEGSLISPADADSILSCGAVDASGALTYFSSWGPTSDGRTKPEVCAQGQGTVCADPYNLQGYTTASGTSLSTPLVGGASGVLLSAHPNWKPTMVREALMMTASKFDSTGNAYGWGIMDVSRALYYHPAGDILFDTRPVAFVGIGQPIDISASITGGSGISSAFLYYTAWDSGEFVEIPMTTADNVNFTAQIPGQNSVNVYYYIKAIDTNGSYAFLPLGGDTHPFKVVPGSSTFDDSFENGIQYWKAGGTNNFWGLTGNRARTGNLCITDSPTFDYRNQSNSYLESAFSLNLSGATTANMAFYWAGDLQSGHDTVFVEASSDGGTTWNRVGANLTGIVANFTLVNANLSPYLNQPDVHLRFHLVTDASGRREGFYLDDIVITVSRPANIAFSPSAINDTLGAGESRTENLMIRNTGGADLIVNLAATEFSMSAKNPDKNDPPVILNTWLFVSPSADTLVAGDSLIAQVSLMAGALPSGAYEGQISINSNDPDSPSNILPVVMVIGGLCQYVSGDANGNGTFNGIDVTYSVNYLKGIGQVPPDACDCPPHGMLYAGADANGNCAFNGIDVTYSVNYLKGIGPAPLACADCPPGR